MRQSQQKNRMRGRGRKGPNPLSRTFESNGPDVKVRGTASHVAEKYAALARDAISSGDIVMAENYFQHAEHYYRIVAAAAAQSGRPEDAGLGRGPQPEFGSDDDGDEDGYEQRAESQGGDYQRHDNPRGDYQRHDNPRSDNQRHDNPRGEYQRNDNQRDDYRRSDNQRNDNQRHDNQRSDNPRGDYQRGEHQRNEQRRPERQHRVEIAAEQPVEAEQPHPPAADAGEPRVRAEGSDQQRTPRPESRNRRRPRQQEGERVNGNNGGHEAEAPAGGRPARADRSGVSSDAAMLPDSILGRASGPAIGADD